MLNKTYSPHIATVICIFLTISTFIVICPWLLFSLDFSLPGVCLALLDLAVLYSLYSMFKGFHRITVVEDFFVISDFFNIKKVTLNRVIGIKNIYRKATYQSPRYSIDGIHVLEIDDGINRFLLNTRAWERADYIAFINEIKQMGIPYTETDGDKLSGLTGS